MFVGHIAMPKNAEDVKIMQEKDAKIKDLEDKCKKLVSRPQKNNFFSEVMSCCFDLVQLLVKICPFPDYNIIFVGNITRV